MTGEGGYKKYKNDVYWGEMMSSGQEEKEITIPNGKLVFTLSKDRSVRSVRFICDNNGLNHFLNKENVVNNNNRQFQTNRLGLINNSQAGSHIDYLYYELFVYIERLCSHLVLIEKLFESDRKVSAKSIVEIYQFVCACIDSDIRQFLSNQSCEDISSLNTFFSQKRSAYELIAKNAIVTKFASDVLPFYPKSDFSYYPAKVCDRKKEKFKKSIVGADKNISKTLETLPTLGVSERDLDYISDAYEDCKKIDFKFARDLNSDNYIKTCSKLLESYKYRVSFSFFGKKCSFFRRQHYAEAKAAALSLKEAATIEQARKILHDFEKQISSKRTHNPAGASVAIFGLYAKGAAFLNNKKGVQGLNPESNSLSPTLST